MLSYVNLDAIRNLPSAELCLSVQFDAMPSEQYGAMLDEIARRTILFKRGDTYLSWVMQYPSRIAEYREAAGPDSIFLIDHMKGGEEMVEAHELYEVDTVVTLDTPWEELENREELRNATDDELEAMRIVYEKIQAHAISNESDEDLPWFPFIFRPVAKGGK